MSGLKIAVDSTIGTSYGLGEGDMARELEAFSQENHGNNLHRKHPIDLYIDPYFVVTLDSTTFTSVTAHAGCREAILNNCGLGTCQRNVSGG